MKKQVAKVMFETAYHQPLKTYNFLTDISDLEKGDTVVVDTVNGLTIAKFDSYDDLGFGETGVKTPSKWVIQKVDIKAHNERLAAAERVKKLKTMLETERKKAAELEIYEILAKSNPEMASLLNEYKQLQEVL